MREFRLDTAGPAGRLRRPPGDRRGRPLHRASAARTDPGACRRGAVHLIADLGQVDFLDSTGLGVLVGGLKRLREDGGSLALVITTPAHPARLGLFQRVAPHRRKAAALSSCSCILDGRVRRGPNGIEDQQHLVAFDQLAGLLDGLGWTVGVIIRDEVDLAAVDPAFVVHAS